MCEDRPAPQTDEDDRGHDPWPTKGGGPGQGQEKDEQDPVTSDQDPAQGGSLVAHVHDMVSRGNECTEGRHVSRDQRNSSAIHLHHPAGVQILLHQQERRALCPGPHTETLVVVGS